MTIINHPTKLTYENYNQFAGSGSGSSKENFQIKIQQNMERQFEKICRQVDRTERATSQRKSRRAKR